MIAETDRRTPLARARGLGSAKHGVQHWWAQRLTALALVPLGIWFAASIIRLAGADYYTVIAWIGQPVVAILLILLVVASFRHAVLGMQVVYEDYLHRHWLRLVFDLGTKAAAFVVAVAAILAILSIAIGPVRL
jgi:succinate dehydrogenase / fumarate reductase, membrane anchor subunit